MTDDNSFDYSSEMRDYYKSNDTAEEYHKKFAKNKDWRHRLIADREKKTIETLLRKVPHDTVLDIPTGTGKLAPVFADNESAVLACDISEDMLKFARMEYRNTDIEEARFQVCDAEEVSRTIDETFDLAVCLRLLHRVPTDTKRNILAELGTIADYVIASTGIETQFHKFRRRMRQHLLGHDGRGNCYETPAVTREIFSDGFEIVASKRVLPILSQEHVFLLRSNEK
jgi:SAM-dependent methyltransferase